MPSPERQEGDNRNSERRRSPEQERYPYHRAARFTSEPPALRAYAEAQDLIFRERDRADLSVYRFLLDRASHVAVLGEPPPEGLDQRLGAILANGEPAALPPEILTLLRARRAQATRQGPWVEGHYRPGRRVTGGGGRG